jgi:ABC-type transporter Mla maintaining outer membrane lipid asymmetry permease subunit MlaE
VVHALTASALAPMALVVDPRVLAGTVGMPLVEDPLVGIDAAGRAPAIGTTIRPGAST